MNSKSPKNVVDRLSDSFQAHFGENLDYPLLVRVLEKEIIKRRESFLQVQLTSFSLSISEMQMLRAAAKSKVKMYNEKQVLSNNRSESVSNSSEKRDEPGPKSKDTNPTKEESTEIQGKAHLSKEELKLEKRRAYARAYYQRKKLERVSNEPKMQKDFKTTPEQRAYQRSYYRRKKDLEKGPGPIASIASKIASAQQKKNDELSLSIDNEKHLGNSKRMLLNNESSSGVEKFALDSAFKELESLFSGKDRIRNDGAEVKKTKLRKSKLNRDNII